MLARVWTKLNSYDYVERYAYWNDEWACSKILWNDNLTPAGEYYSQMKTGVSYSGTYEFVPKDWRLTAVNDLKATYNQKNGVVTLTWTNNNGDLSETVTLQRRKGTGSWQTVETITRPDDRILTCTEELTDNGLFSYRVVEKTYKSTTLTSNTTSVSIANSFGTEEMQYGRIDENCADTITVNCLDMDARPIVFLGMPTNANSTVGVVPRVTIITKKNFNFALQPWGVPDGSSITKSETVDFLALKAGQYQWGTMRAEVDTCRYITDSGTESKMSSGDTIEVFFRQPFADDITPIVIVQPFTSNKSTAPATAKVFDVTNLGFKMKLVKQDGETRNIARQYAYYIAITPGQANLEDTGKSIVAGRCHATPVGGTVSVACKFTDTEGSAVSLRNPYLIAAPQTHNLDHASLFRQASAITTSAKDNDGEDYIATTGIRVRRQMDTGLTSSQIGTNTAAANGDIVGWIAVNDGTLEELMTIRSIKDEQRSDSDEEAIYDLQGRRVNKPTHGFYIIQSADGRMQGKKGKKVFVK